MSILVGIGICVALIVLLTIGLRYLFARMLRQTATEIVSAAGAAGTSAGVAVGRAMGRALAKRNLH